ncbi:MAG: hypothetical protein ABIH69_02940 [bacterium]
MRLVVTRPQHDVTTSYLFVWAKEIINLAENKGVQVTDLQGENANRHELEGRIRKLQPESIFLNGHGNEDHVTGHNDEILIKMDDNHEILEGRITYALACKSGKLLGQRISKNNGATYIGYSDDFIFICDHNHIARPLTDPKAQPFMESSNQVMISLLKGHSAQEASERSKNVFNKHFTRLLSSSTDPDSLQTAKYLWWNMRNQVCLGNGEATL